MPNSIFVDKDVYNLLNKRKKGEEFRTYIHSHGKLRGSVDVRSANLKPIPCMLQPVNPGRNVRRGSKPKRIEVILMRK
jgi:hypothetical protein